MSKYLLAFDTSSDDIVLNIASFAYDKQELLSVLAKTHHAPRAANTELLPCIDAALAQAGISRSELSAVAVGIIAGSYTGVRIGVATAKGMAQALGIPLFGLSITAEKLSPDHLLERFEQAYQYQTGDPATVLPQYPQLSYAEEAEKKQHPERYRSAQPVFKSEPVSSKSLASPVNPAITLRALTPYDIDALSKLAGSIACFTWTRQHYADELQMANHLWLGAFAADREGRQQLIGYAGANASVKEADLLQTAIHPDWRKQGIATALFERLFDRLREVRAESLTLEVREGNTAARKLYESLGFEQISVREDYYKNPVENALVLRRKCTEHAHSSQESLLLGIETSCDETAAAVMEDAQLLSNVVASQAVFHARFGGVVPEIASRKHSEAIVTTVEQAMFDAGIARIVKQGRCASRYDNSPVPFSELTGIAVTDRPGLIGALVVGQAYAKGLAWALKIPLYGINHLEGHLYACAIDDASGDTDANFDDLPSPHLSLIVSGGHTVLLHSSRPHEYTTLGETLDDAAGEAFDKVAKVLGLGYPGGPILSKLANSGNPQAIDFPRAMIHSKDFAFSLSGLKTAVITYIRDAEQKGDPLNIPDIAASFQQAIVDVKVAKVLRAAKKTESEHFIMAGGVAANAVLREALIQALAVQGIQTYIPPLKYCGDNAAMIVRVAAARLQAEERAKAAGEASGKYLSPAPLSADCASSGSLDT